MAAITTAIATAAKKAAEAVSSKAAAKKAAEEAAKKAAKKGAVTAADKLNKDRDGRRGGGLLILIAMSFMILTMLVSVLPNVIWNCIFHIDETADPVQDMETELALDKDDVLAKEQKLASIIEEYITASHDDALSDVKTAIENNGCDYDLSMQNLTDNVMMPTSEGESELSGFGIRQVGLMLSAFSISQNNLMGTVEMTEEERTETDESGFTVTKLVKFFLPVASSRDTEQELRNILEKNSGRFFTVTYGPITEKTVNEKQPQLDPDTGEQVLDSDGNPIMVTVSVTKKYYSSIIISMIDIKSAMQDIFEVDPEAPYAPLTDEEMGITTEATNWDIMETMTDHSLEMLYGFHDSAGLSGYGGPLSGHYDNLTGETWMWPCPSSHYITYPYGYRYHPVSGGWKFHSGIDISAGTGQDILAAASGKVTLAQWYQGYGNCVMIDHGSGVTTLYGHMSVIGCLPGQTVKQGDVIGLVGSTGISTGPHLHFEVRVNNQTMDPMLFVN